MSVLQDISKRLLAVASMPPEKRNDALIEVKIEIEGVQYDMVLEQKDLIMNIIDELIAENNADQIAKSKLVFVPDVEEQIAPTKKTRAKKVVAPVMEVNGEDLPDVIENYLFVRDLPEPVKKWAIYRSKQQGKIVDDKDVKFDDTLRTILDWDATLEGFEFWKEIHEKGELGEFKKKFGNKGERVDELINPAPAVKTRKPRTPKVKIKSSIVLFVELSFELLNGDVINLTVENPTELQLIVTSILKKLDTLEFIFDFGANTESDNYKTSVLLKIDDSPIVMLQKLQKEYDTFVKPELDWNYFKNRASDSITIENNEEIINDAFTQKLASVVAPAVKTRKPRTPKVTKNVEQNINKVVVRFNSPQGVNIKLDNFSFSELFDGMSAILYKLKYRELSVNIEIETDNNNYFDNVILKQTDMRFDFLITLTNEFSKIRPMLNWNSFYAKPIDETIRKLNEIEIENAFNPAPVVAPKPVKVVTPKPAKVVMPKPVKVVAPKVVKTKVTKPKVEDDLSFLNDLDNIF